MTAEREIAVPYEDLARVSIRCKQCSAEVVFDVRNDKQFKPRADPWPCPGCNATFDSKIKDAVTGLTIFFNSADAAGHPISFRVKDPD